MMRSSEVSRSRGGDESRLDPSSITRPSILVRSAIALANGSLTAEYNHRHHIHQLSPTFFLPRAADIEPDVRNSFVFRVRLPLLILFRP
jgi:hypothetical protein